MRRTDHRQSRATRHRGFDDDNAFAASAPFAQRPFRESTPAPSFASGPELNAVVKWFNPEKGFGFVELGDGSGDAFLHGSVLARAGASSVNPGASLRIRVGQGQKGPQVTEVLEVADAPATARPQAAAPRRQFETGVSEEMRGTVKWYNTSKGFGFIVPESGGKDIFVHASVLARGGLTQLSEGQVVRVQVVQGKKGPEASSISLD